MKTRNSVKIRYCLGVAGLLLPLLLAGTVAWSSERAVYRWVDEDGVMHFTHQPPQSAEFDLLRPDTSKIGTVAPTKPEASINVSAARQAAQTASTDGAEDILDLDEEELAIACQQAADNVVALEPVKRILVPDGSGGTRQLDDSERLEWLARSRSFISENCN